MEDYCHEGFLDKQGALWKSWQTRWFVIRNEPDGSHAMYYFVKDPKISPDEKNYRGKVNLAGAQLSPYLKISGRRHCFGVKAVNEDRMYILSASTDQLRISWLNSLTSCGALGWIQQLTNTDKAITSSITEFGDAIDYGASDPPENKISTTSMRPSIVANRRKYSTLNQSSLQALRTAHLGSGGVGGGSSVHSSTPGGAMGTGGAGGGYPGYDTLRQSSHRMSFAGHSFFDQPNASSGVVDNGLNRDNNDDTISISPLQELSSSGAHGVSTMSSSGGAKKSTVASAETLLVAPTTAIQTRQQSTLPSASVAASLHHSSSNLAAITNQLGSGFFPSHASHFPQQLQYQRGDLHDNGSSEDDDDGDERDILVLEGFLGKKPHRVLHTWKQRWCQLYTLPPRILYFKTQSDAILFSTQQQRTRDQHRARIAQANGMDRYGGRASFISPTNAPLLPMSPDAGSSMGSYSTLGGASQDGEQSSAPTPVAGGGATIQPLGVMHLYGATIASHGTSPNTFLLQLGWGQSTVQIDAKTPAIRAKWIRAMIPLVAVSGNFIRRLIELSQTMKINIVSSSSGASGAAGGGASAASGGGLGASSNTTGTAGASTSGSGNLNTLLGAKQRKQGQKTMESLIKDGEIRAEATQDMHSLVQQYPHIPADMLYVCPPLIIALHDKTIILREIGRLWPLLLQQGPMTLSGELCKQGKHATQWKSRTCALLSGILLYFDNDKPLSEAHLAATQSKKNILAVRDLAMYGFQPKLDINSVAVADGYDAFQQDSLLPTSPRPGMSGGDSLPSIPVTSTTTGGVTFDYAQSTVGSVISTKTTGVGGVPSVTTAGMGAQQSSRQVIKHKDDPDFYEPIYNYKEIDLMEDYDNYEKISLLVDTTSWWWPQAEAEYLPLGAISLRNCSVTLFSRKTHPQLQIPREYQYCIRISTYKANPDLGRIFSFCCRTYSDVMRWFSHLSLSAYSGVLRDHYNNGFWASFPPQPSMRSYLMLPLQPLNVRTLNFSSGGILPHALPFLFSPVSHRLLVTVLPILSATMSAQQILMLLQSSRLFSYISLMLIRLVNQGKLFYNDGSGVGSSYCGGFLRFPISSTVRLIPTRDEPNSESTEPQSKLLELLDHLDARLSSISGIVGNIYQQLSDHNQQQVLQLLYHSQQQYQQMASSPSSLYTTPSGVTHGSILAHNTRNSTSDIPTSSSSLSVVVNSTTGDTTSSNGGGGNTQPLATPRQGHQIRVHGLQAPPSATGGSSGLRNESSNLSHTQSSLTGGGGMGSGQQPSLRSSRNSFLFTNGQSSSMLPLSNSTSSMQFHGNLQTTASAGSNVGMGTFTGGGGGLPSSASAVSMVGSPLLTSLHPASSHIHSPSLGGHQNNNTTASGAVGHLVVPDEYPDLTVTPSTQLSTEPELYQLTDSLKEFLSNYSFRRAFMAYWATQEEAYVSWSATQLSQAQSTLVEDTAYRFTTDLVTHFNRDKPSSQHIHGDFPSSLLSLNPTVTQTLSCAPVTAAIGFRHLIFWLACEDYATLIPSSFQQRYVAHRLYETYLAPGAAYPVYSESAAMEEVANILMNPSSTSNSGAGGAGNTSSPTPAHQLQSPTVSSGAGGATSGATPSLPSASPHGAAAASGLGSGNDFGIGSIHYNSLLCPDASNITYERYTPSYILPSISQAGSPISLSSTVFRNVQQLVHEVIATDVYPFYLSRHTGNLQGDIKTRPQQQQQQQYNTMTIRSPQQNSASMGDYSIGDGETTTAGTLYTSPSGVNSHMSTIPSSTSSFSRELSQSSGNLFAAGPGSSVKTSRMATPMQSASPFANDDNYVYPHTSLPILTEDIIVRRLAAAGFPALSQVPSSGDGLASGGEFSLQQQASVVTTGQSLLRPMSLIQEQILIHGEISRRLRETYLTKENPTSITAAARQQSLDQLILALFDHSYSVFDKTAPPVAKQQQQQPPTPYYPYLQHQQRGNQPSDVFNSSSTGAFKQHPNRSVEPPTPTSSSNVTTSTTIQQQVGYSPFSRANNTPGGQQQQQSGGGATPMSSSTTATGGGGGTSMSDSTFSSTIRDPYNANMTPSQHPNATPSSTSISTSVTTTLSPITIPHHDSSLSTLGGLRLPSAKHSTTGNRSQYRFYSTDSVEECDEDLHDHQHHHPDHDVQIPPITTHPLYTPYIDSFNYKSVDRKHVYSLPLTFDAHNYTSFEQSLDPYHQPRLATTLSSDTAAVTVPTTSGNGNPTNTLASQTNKHNPFLSASLLAALYPPRQSRSESLVIPGEVNLVVQSVIKSIQQQTSALQLVISLCGVNRLLELGIDPNRLDDDDDDDSEDDMSDEGYNVQDLDGPMDATGRTTFSRMSGHQHPQMPAVPTPTSGRQQVHGGSTTPHNGEDSNENDDDDNYEDSMLSQAHDINDISTLRHQAVPAGRPLPQSLSNAETTQIPMDTENDLDSGRTTFKQLFFGKKKSLLPPPPTGQQRSRGQKKRSSRGLYDHTAIPVEQRAHIFTGLPLGVVLGRCYTGIPPAIFYAQHTLANMCLFIADCQAFEHIRYNTPSTYTVFGWQHRSYQSHLNLMPVRFDNLPSAGSLALTGPRWTDAMHMYDAYLSASAPLALPVPLQILHKFKERLHAEAQRIETAVKEWKFQAMHAAKLQYRENLQSAGRYTSSTSGAGTTVGGMPSSAGAGVVPTSPPPPQRNRNTSVLERPSIDVTNPTTPVLQQSSPTSTEASGSFGSTTTTSQGVPSNTLAAGASAASGTTVHGTPIVITSSVTPSAMQGTPHGASPGLTSYHHHHLDGTVSKPSAASFPYPDITIVPPLWLECVDPTLFRDLASVVLTCVTTLMPFAQQEGVSLKMDFEALSTMVFSPPLHSDPSQIIPFSQHGTSTGDKKLIRGLTPLDITAANQANSPRADTPSSRGGVGGHLTPANATTALAITPRSHSSQLPVDIPISPTSAQQSLRLTPHKNRHGPAKPLNTKPASPRGYPHISTSLGSLTPSQLSLGEFPLVNGSAIIDVVETIGISLLNRYPRLPPSVSARAATRYQRDIASYNMLWQQQRQLHLKIYDLLLPEEMDPLVDSLLYNAKASYSRKKAAIKQGNLPPSSQDSIAAGHGSGTGTNSSPTHAYTSSQSPHTSAVPPPPPPPPMSTILSTGCGSSAGTSTTGAATPSTVLSRAESIGSSAPYPGSIAFQRSGSSQEYRNSSSISPREADQLPAHPSNEHDDVDEHLRTSVMSENGGTTTSPLLPPQGSSSRMSISSRHGGSFIRHRQTASDAGSLFLKAKQGYVSPSISNRPSIALGNGAGPDAVSPSDVAQDPDLLDSTLPQGAARLSDEDGTYNDLNGIPSQAQSTYGSITAGSKTSHTTDGNGQEPHALPFDVSKKPNLVDVPSHTLQSLSFLQEVLHCTRAASIFRTFLQGNVYAHTIARNRCLEGRCYIYSGIESGPQTAVFNPYRHDGSVFTYYDDQLDKHTSSMYGFSSDILLASSHTPQPIPSRYGVPPSPFLAPTTGRSIPATGSTSSMYPLPPPPPPPSPLPSPSFSPIAGPERRNPDGTMRRPSSSSSLSALEGGLDFLNHSHSDSEEQQQYGSSAPRQPPARMISPRGSGQPSSPRAMANDNALDGTMLTPPQRFQRLASHDGGVHNHSPGYTSAILATPLQTPKSFIKSHDVNSFAPILPRSPIATPSNSLMRPPSLSNQASNMSLSGTRLSTGGIPHHHSGGLGGNAYEPTSPMSRNSNRASMPSGGGRSLATHDQHRQQSDYYAQPTASSSILAMIPPEAEGYPAPHGHGQHTSSSTSNSQSPGLTTQPMTRQRSVSSVSRTSSVSYIPSTNSHHSRLHIALGRSGMSGGDGDDDDDDDSHHNYAHHLQTHHEERHAAGGDDEHGASSDGSQSRFSNILDGFSFDSISSLSSSESEDDDHNGSTAHPNSSFSSRRPLSTPRAAATMIGAGSTMASHQQQLSAIAPVSSGIHPPAIPTPRGTDSTDPARYIPNTLSTGGEFNPHPATLYGVDGYDHGEDEYETASIVSHTAYDVPPFSPRVPHVVRSTSRVAGSASQNAFQIVNESSATTHSGSASGEHSGGASTFMLVASSTVGSGASSTNNNNPAAPLLQPRVNTYTNHRLPYLENWKPRDISSQLPGYLGELSSAYGLSNTTLTSNSSSRYRRALFALDLYNALSGLQNLCAPEMMVPYVKYIATKFGLFPYASYYTCVEEGPYGKYVLSTTTAGVNGGNSTTTSDDTAMPHVDPSAPSAPSLYNKTFMLNKSPLVCQVGCDCEATTMCDHIILVPNLDAVVSLSPSPSASPRHYHHNSHHDGEEVGERHYDGESSHDHSHHQQAVPAQSSSTTIVSRRLNTQPPSSHVDNESGVDHPQQDESDDLLSHGIAPIVIGNSPSKRSSSRPTTSDDVSPVVTGDNPTNNPSSMAKMPSYHRRGSGGSVGYAPSHLSHTYSHTQRSTDGYYTSSSHHHNVYSVDAGRGRWSSSFPPAASHTPRLTSPPQYYTTTAILPCYTPTPEAPDLLHVMPPYAAWRLIALVASILRADTPHYPVPKHTRCVVCRHSGAARHVVDHVTGDSQIILPPICNVEGFNMNYEAFAHYTVNFDPKLQVTATITEDHMTRIRQQVETHNRVQMGQSIVSSTGDASKGDLVPQQSGEDGHTKEATTTTTTTTLQPPAVALPSSSVTVTSTSLDPLSNPSSRHIQHASGSTTTSGYDNQRQYDSGSTASASAHQHQHRTSLAYTEIQFPYPHQPRGESNRCYTSPFTFFTHQGYLALYLAPFFHECLSTPFGYLIRPAILRHRVHSVSLRHEVIPPSPLVWARDFFMNAIHRYALPDQYALYAPFPCHSTRLFNNLRHFDVNGVRSLAITSPLAFRVFLPLVRQQFVGDSFAMLVDYKDSLWLPHGAGFFEQLRYRRWYDALTCSHSIWQVNISFSLRSALKAAMEGVSDMQRENAILDNVAVLLQSLSQTIAKRFHDGQKTTSDEEMMVSSLRALVLAQSGGTPHSQSSNAMSGSIIQPPTPTSSSDINTSSSPSTTPTSALVSPSSSLSQPSSPSNHHDRAANALKTVCPEIYRYLSTHTNPQLYHLLLSAINGTLSLGLESFGEHPQSYTGSTGKPSPFMHQYQYASATPPPARGNVNIHSLSSSMNALSLDDSPFNQKTHANHVTPVRSPPLATHPAGQRSMAAPLTLRPHQQQQQQQPSPIAHYLHLNTHDLLSSPSITAEDGHIPQTSMASTVKWAISRGLGLNDPAHYLYEFISQFSPLSAPVPSVEDKVCDETSNERYIHYYYDRSLLSSRQPHFIVHTGNDQPLSPELLNTQDIAPSIASDIYTYRSILPSFTHQSHEQSSGDGGDSKRQRLTDPVATATTTTSQHQQHDKHGRRTSAALSHVSYLSCFSQQLYSPDITIQLPEFTLRSMESSHKLRGFWIDSRLSAFHASLLEVRQMVYSGALSQPLHLPQYSTLTQIFMERPVDPKLDILQLVLDSMRGGSGGQGDKDRLLATMGLFLDTGRHRRLLGISSAGAGATTLQTFGVRLPPILRDY